MSAQSAANHPHLPVGQLDYRRFANTLGLGRISRGRTEDRAALPRPPTVIAVDCSHLIGAGTFGAEQLVDGYNHAAAAGQENSLIHRGIKVGVLCQATAASPGQAVVLRSPKKSSSRSCISATAIVAESQQVVSPTHNVGVGHRGPSAKGGPLVPRAAPIAAGQGEGCFPATVLAWD